MFDLMQNEKSRNFLIILCLFLGLLSLGYFIATFRQHAIMWSHYSVEEYDKRIKVFSNLSGDIEASAMCQNELNKATARSENYTDLKIQCAKYGIDLNRDLFGVKAYFVLDDQTRQKISAIINRKDKDTFDKQSTTLAKQVLEVLDNQLKQEAKKLGFQP